MNCTLFFINYGLLAGILPLQVFHPQETGI
jgi:hypothetical protein